MSPRLRKTWPALVLGGLTALSLAAAARSAGSGPKAAPTQLNHEPAPTPPLTANERALAAIRAEGRVRVRNLAGQIAETADPQARRDLERRVVALKQEYRVRFLEALAAQAGARGDFDVRDEARHQIDLIHNPPVPKHGPPSPEELRKMKIVREGRP